jgi:hypothetical protein
MTRQLKEAILLAAEAVGEDGKGKNGLTGYLINVARKHPDLFMPMLGKVLSLQINSKPETVKPSEVPYRTLDDVMQAFLDRHVPIELWPQFLRDMYEKKIKVVHDTPSPQRDEVARDRDRSRGASEWRSDIDVTEKPVHAVLGCALSLDAPDVFCIKISPCHFQVVVGLQIQPEFRTVAEVQT